MMNKLTSSLVLAKSRASSLETVKNLNCWGSDIFDISVVENMPNLEVVSLSLNNITSLKDLAHCPKLKEVYLRKNSITDISEICYLKNLALLKVMWLSDNPCALDPLYRLTVIRNLPCLKKLDNQEITEDEIRLAALKGKSFTPPETLPDFSDLDLSNTLKLRDLTKYRQFVHRDERPGTPSTDSRTDDDDIYPVPEDERKNLSLRKSVIQTKQDIRQDSPLKTNTSSGMLPAVLHLLKELETFELQIVIREAEQRIGEINGHYEVEME